MQRAKMVLIGVTVAGAGLLWGLGAGTPGGDSSLPDPESARPGLDLRAGVRQVYEVDVQSAVEIGDGAAAKNWLHRLRGRLDLQVIGDVDSGFRMAGRLTDPRQEVDGVACPDPLLGTFFSVGLDSSGRLAGFEVARNLPAASRGQLRGLLGLFQVVLPAGAASGASAASAASAVGVAGVAGADSWRTTEDSDHGPCTVVYRRAERELTRCRLTYRPADGMRVRVIASHGRFTLAASGVWLQRAEVVEEIEAQHGAAQRVRAETRGTLRLVARPVAVPMVVAERLVAARAQVQRAQDARQRAVEATRRPLTPADRRHFLDLLARLDQATAPGPLLDELRDALLTHPELCALVPDLLRRDRYTDLTASTLIHALKMAGHGAAQTALADLASDDELPQRLRVRAVVDLGGVAEPAADTRRRLWQLSERSFDAASCELASTATLALGRLGRSMRASGDEHYDGLRARLQASLGQVNDARQRGVLLAAAGNTGDPALRPAVLDHLRAADPQARAAAAKALGRIPESQAVMLRGLAEEPNGRVRCQLARGLAAQGELGEAPLRLVVQKLAHENDESARFALARLIGQSTADDATATQALRELLRTESSARIRQYAAGRLAAR